MDGQVGLYLRHNDRIRASRAKHRIHIIQPRKLRFFNVLRNKMKWGQE